LHTSFPASSVHAPALGFKFGPEIESGLLFLYFTSECAYYAHSMMRSALTVHIPTIGVILMCVRDQRQGFPPDHSRRNLLLSKRISDSEERLAQDLRLKAAREVFISTTFDKRGAVLGWN